MVLVPHKVATFPNGPGAPRDVPLIGHLRNRMSLGNMGVKLLGF